MVVHRIEMPTVVAVLRVVADKADKADKAGERPTAAFAPDMSLLEAAKRKHPHASVLTAGQEAGLQLLQVADHLQQLGEAGMGVKASTVYEMVAEPISNALSQLVPKQYVHTGGTDGGPVMLYDRTVVQVYRTWIDGNWSELVAQLCITS